MTTQLTGGFRPRPPNNVPNVPACLSDRSLSCNGLFTCGETYSWKRLICTDHDDFSSPSASSYLLSALPCGCGLVHVVVNQMYSPANVQAKFSIQAVTCRTRLLCVLAITSPIGFCLLFCMIFRQLSFFGYSGAPYHTYFR